MRKGVTGRMHGNKKEGQKDLSNIIVLIPSLDPDKMLQNYVKDLLDAGIEKIVIVNDGSSEDKEGYFQELESDKVTILKHAVNEGKGRALKTGLHFILNTYTPDDIAGVVTADADGQHSAADTVRIAQEVLKTNSFILGTRDFNEEQVPFKSRNGNKITTNVFWLFFGKRISDTQTGLRGIPFAYLKNCLKLKGERFEYEINMLIDVVRKGLSILEVPIQTIYYESNRATHFSAFRDSAKIYGVILGEFLKFSLSGISSFIVDIGMFTVLTKLFFDGLPIHKNLFLATVIARIISSILNYSINRKVFENSESVKKTVIKYYALCIIQLLLSWILVTLVYGQMKFDTTIIKICVDFLLFLVSYRIQRGWVFKEYKS